MKVRRILTAVIAGQFFAVTGVANAATIDDIYSAPKTASRAGAFAGARLRLALGGKAKTEDARLHAGLSFAPIRQSISTDGSSRIVYSDGLEFGFASRAPVGFSLAGRPLSKKIGNERLGISTVGKVAIGVGVALVAVVAVLFIRYEDAINDPER